MPYAIPLLKHKLRQLKKLERKIRSTYRPIDSTMPLIWDAFFSTKPGVKRVKYPLLDLREMNDEDYQKIIEEFLFRVYYQHWKENGFYLGDVYDPQLLKMLDLPSHAGYQDIKKRFRELALQHHPDRGGDADRFIELMEIYEQLTGDKFR